ncbi:MAG TPA: AMP-binding protein [Candidatus Margulisiibacteriota bacterium]|nr:AMP-binding protein [Candidatus Margulisiibacteriota bacterium]
MELNPRIPGHFIQLKAKESPDKVIFTFEGWSTGNADEAITYRSLWENSAKVAHELVRNGMQPRDTFAIFMRNHSEFLYAILGGSIAGCVFVPIDPRQKGDKLRYQLQHAECKAIVTTTDLLPAVEALRPQLGSLRVILASQRPGGPPATGALVRSYQEVLAEPLRNEPEQRVTDVSQPIQVIYTSGTTGDPKGVVAETGRWTGTAGMVGGVFGYTQDDRLYTGLSLTHGNAQVVTFLAGLYNDVPAVFSPRFTKSKIWDICRRYGCTTFSLLGGMMAAIYAEPRRPDDGDNPVRFVLSAGTPRAIWEDFEKRFNTRILEWYGAVEGGFAFKPIGQGPIGSFGRPIPGVMEIKIVDEDDNECPPGVTGELISRVAGAETKVEYLKNPEASAAKTRGGWLRSGDMCHRDADGWLFFDYRKGTEIRHNGEFIQPDFVQKVLAEFPEVDDVYVYGIPAKSGAPGEKDVVAAVVLVSGARFDPVEFFRACAAQLERNQIPSYVQVLPEIPKTASEKPQDRYLIDDLKWRRNPVHEFEDYAGQLAAC